MGDLGLLMADPLAQACAEGRKTVRVFDLILNLDKAPLTEDFVVDFHRERAEPGRKLFQRGGSSPMEATHLARRIANGIGEAPEDGCWAWIRSTNKTGYPTIKLHGRRTVGGHRLALILHVGRVLGEDEHACHSCDNPACVRPSHLFVGTRSDNMSDAHEKGRLRPPTPRLYGSANPASRLTASSVREIRALHGAGNTQRSIAGQFGVSQPTISDIVNGRTWSHLE